MIVLLVVVISVEAVRRPRSFFTGLGAGLITGIYDYAGYNPTAYMGAELKNPGRVMPRSIIYSIMAIIALYWRCRSCRGCLPWREIVKSTSVTSLVVTHNWSHTAAEVVTGFIVVAAFASVFTALLGGSRVPYHAAQDGTFFRVFGRLHHKYEFPHLQAMGGLHHRHVLQPGDDDRNAGRGVGTAAVRRPGRRRHRAAPAPAAPAPGVRLYPLLSLLALVGWIYALVSATSTSPILSSAWVVAGVVAFLIWAWVNRAWPFAPLEIREQYLDEQRARPTEPAQLARDAVSA